MTGAAGWGNAPRGTEQGPYVLDGIEVRRVDLRYSGVSKPIACMLGGGKSPRLSEVHYDRDSVCED